MVLNISGCWKNTKDMPFPMRTLCQGTMVAGPILIFALILPIAAWRIGERYLSYGELWSSGVGETMIIFIGSTTVGAWLLAMRKERGRRLVMLGTLVPSVLVLVVPAFSDYAGHSQKLEFILQVIAFYGLQYWALFRWAAFQVYLGQGAVDHESAA